MMKILAIALLSVIAPLAEAHTGIAQHGLAVRTGTSLPGAGSSAGDGCRRNLGRKSGRQGKLAYPAGVYRHYVRFSITVSGLAEYAIDRKWHCCVIIAAWPVHCTGG